MCSMSETSIVEVTAVQAPSEVITLGRTLKK